MEQILEKLEELRDEMRGQEWTMNSRSYSDGVKALTKEIESLKTRVMRLKNLKEDLSVREGSLGWPADMAHGYETACQTVSEQIGEILS
jgi:hypothetical protein